MARPLRRALRVRPARCGLGTAGIVGFLIVWQLIPTLGIISPQYLPYATETLARLFSELRDLEFWRNVGRTMTAWFFGLLIATVAATMLGTVIGLVPFLRRATHTTVEFLRPIPSVALIPLAVLDLRHPTASGPRDHRVRQLLAGLRAGALRRGGCGRRGARHRPKLRLDPWRAGPIPDSADGPAVPDDGAPAGGIRGAHPRDHRGDGDRQLPASGAPSSSTKPPATGSASTRSSS